MQHLNITTEILDLAEARRRIPLLRPHVQLLMESSKNLRALHSRIVNSGAEEEGVLELRDDFGREEKRFREALQQINNLGAYVKDPETGLLDFYTWRDGDMVFLCWHHGEETIHSWHGLDEGFSRRKPVDAPTGSEGA